VVHAPRHVLDDRPGTQDLLANVPGRAKGGEVRPAVVLEDNDAHLPTPLLWDLPIEFRVIFVGLPVGGTVPNVPERPLDLEPEERLLVLQSRLEGLLHPVGRSLRDVVEVGLLHHVAAYVDVVLYDRLLPPLPYRAVLPELNHAVLALNL